MLNIIAHSSVFHADKGHLKLTHLLDVLKILATLTGQENSK